MASQLFVNGIELDLTPGTVIPITIQDYNPLIPDQVKYSYSGRIRVPITQTNKSALNYLDNLGVVSSAYKARQPARFVQNGLELIPDGYVIYLGIKDNYFELAIYAGYLDLFAQLRDKMLTDLSYTDVNRTWTETDVDALRLEAEVAGGVGKVFTLVVNYGKNMVYAAPNIEYGVNNLDGFVPVAFGYRQMLEKILTGAGYTFTWGKLKDGTNDNLKFKSLAMLQRGYAGEHYLNYTKKFNTSIEFSAANDAATAVIDLGNGVTQMLTFNTTKIPCAFWNVATANKYVVANADTALNYYQAIIEYNATVWCNVASGGEVSVYVNGVRIAALTVVLTINGDNAVVLNPTKATSQFKNGDVVEIRIKQIVANPVRITVRAFDSFTIKAADKWNGFHPVNYIYFNQLLPEVPQLALFKDFLFRFGQIPKQVNKALTFRSLKDILNDTAVGNNDWTGKRDLSKFDEFGFSLTELAQTNNFQYKVSDQGGNNKYGAGTFLMDDTTLPLEKTTELLFSNTADGATLGLDCGQIPCQAAGGGTVFASNPGFRLLLTRLNTAYEGQVLFVVAGTPRTSYVVGGFTKPSTVNYYERSLSFKNVLEEWYTETGAPTTGFLQRLKNAKWVIRYYNLTDFNIATLDPHKMIQDGDQHFLFPKIFNYQTGVVSKVLMLKI